MLVEHDAGTFAQIHQSKCHIILGVESKNLVK